MDRGCPAIQGQGQAKAGLQQALIEYGLARGASDHKILDSSKGCQADTAAAVFKKRNDIHSYFKRTYGRSSAAPFAFHAHHSYVVKFGVRHLIVKI